MQEYAMPRLVHNGQPGHPGNAVIQTVSSSSRSLRDAANAAVYRHLAVGVWHGSAIDKCPADLLNYQQMIHALRPRIIVETGAWYGGSALFFADMCELFGAGRVLSVELELHDKLPSHPRLTYLQGDSADPATVAAARAWASGAQGMVILDSDHRQSHVLAELDAYSAFVAPGQYLVVEDTNLNGNPVRPEFGPGPAEAVAAWLPRHPEFVVDHEAEPYLTFAPSGYLRRLEDS